MIEVRNIRKSFIRTDKDHKKQSFFAVDNVSFDVNDGEIVGILGPNGAGKTTLLRMVASLMEPTEGSITYKIGGESYMDPLDIKRHIGYLSGNTKLYRRNSPRELMQLFGEIYGIPEDVLSERIDDISKTLNMDEFIDNRLEKLSTGQNQRASIARCLIHSPEVYIFDEPTLGLDIISSSSIIEFMKGEKEKGKTIIYSTHYMEEAEYLCDRILLMNHAKIVLNMTPDELKEKTGKNSIRDAFYEVIRKEDIDEK